LPGQGPASTDVQTKLYIDGELWINVDATLPDWYAW
jgi:hypothetical protein